MEIATLIINDWDDLAVRNSIMDAYGDSIEPFYGKNDDGEDVKISVFPDKIILETMQENGWLRKNYYYYGDEISEEVFSGKWR